MDLTQVSANKIANDPLFVASLPPPNQFRRSHRLPSAVELLGEDLESDEWKEEVAKLHQALKNKRALARAANNIK